MMKAFLIPLLLALASTGCGVLGVAPLSDMDEVTFEAYMTDAVLTTELIARVALGKGDVTYVQVEKVAKALQLLSDGELTNVSNSIVEALNLEGSYESILVTIGIYKLDARLRGSFVDGVISERGQLVLATLSTKLLVLAKEYEDA